MSVYGEQNAFTMVASGDFSAKRYHVVQALAADVFSQADSAGNLGILGVLQNNPLNGEHGTIANLGKSKVVAGAAIAANAMVTTNASGRAIAVSSGQADVIIGRAMEAAAADGNIISVLLQPPTPLGKGAV